MSQLECSGDLPKVQPFEEWLVENHPDWEDEESEKECEECDGSGELKCPECDGTGKVECDECDGSGVKDEIPPKERYREEYKEEVAADLERLKKWMG